MAGAAHERAKADASANEAAMRRLDDVLLRLSPTSVPARHVAATPTLTTIARQQPTKVALDARATALAQRLTLDAQRQELLQALDEAGQCVAVASEAHAAKTVEVESASGALEDLRRQLW